MNIYITGGSGFIGHQLTNKLKSYGISVTNIPRTQLQDLNSFRFKNNSCLVHLAAHVHNISVKDTAEDDRLHFSVNRDLTHSLAKKFFTEVPHGKLIFSSTVHTHGISTKGVFTTEDKPIPESTYGQSKLEAEQLLKSSNNYTVETIAYDSGFNSVSAFYTAFKNINNVTPAVFKKM